MALKRAHLPFLWGIWDSISFLFCYSLSYNYALSREFSVRGLYDVILATNAAGDAHTPTGGKDCY